MDHQDSVVQATAAAILAAEHAVAAPMGDPAPPPVPAAPPPEALHEPSVHISEESTYEDFKEWIKYRRMNITNLDSFEDDMRLWGQHCNFAFRRGRVERYSKNSSYAGKLSRITYECSRARFSTTGGKQKDGGDSNFEEGGVDEHEKNIGGARRQRSRPSDRIGCPWKITLCFSQASNLFHITTDYLDHNHALDLPKDEIGRRLGAKRKRKSDEDIEDEEKRKAALAALNKAHNNSGMASMMEHGRHGMLTAPLPHGPAPPPPIPSHHRYDKAGGSCEHRDELCIVIGVGPGLGGSAARRFAADGYQIGLIGRTEPKLKKVQQEIKDAGGRAYIALADASGKESELQGAIKHLKDQAGGADVAVLVYNASGGGFGWPPPGLLDTNVDMFRKGLNAGCVGALVASKCVAIDMLRNGHGTILLTGATSSLRGGARFAPAACAKFALRALAQSMARELQPSGVHVAHIIIDGQVGDEVTKAKNPDRRPDSFLNPDAVADTYFMLHNQDRTAWTHELELRPFLEKF